jgi:2-amino-4-hydroxy-6-hydroxymethyldihydropteridine diphosphokinase
MKAVIALGSNLENRKLNLDIAVTKLEELLTNLIVSKYIESKAVGGPVQPDYLNAVVIGESNLEPETLLMNLLNIEDQMGRVREIKWGPRIIDLDLIIFGDHIVDSKNLKLPHPLASSRDFVIKPWLSIDPDAAIPGVGAIKNLGIFK